MLFYRAGVLRMNKFYKGSFYPEALKDVYISAGSWPENGADVDDETMAIYTGVAPEGKTLGADKNGNPAWIDIPPLSAEQQIILAEQKRTVLRSMADKEIVWRQDAFDAEIATAEETAALSEWKKYRVLLMRVDTSNPVWPTPPGSRPIDIRRGAGISCRHRVNVIQHSVKSGVFCLRQLPPGLQFQLNQTNGSHCSINQ